jgi:outer membrane lipoprotein SlyB
MTYRYIAMAAGLSASLFAAGCTDNQGINAATGGLLGAAVGSQVGGGSGRTAATLAGAAAGTAIGANATPRRY